MDDGSRKNFPTSNSISSTTQNIKFSSKISSMHQNPQKAVQSVNFTDEIVIWTENVFFLYYGRQYVTRFY